MIILLLFLNFAISWFNSWSVGKSWAETKHIGGLPRFMTWMGAIMASAGFSWCYLIVLAFIAGPDGLNKLPPKYVQAMCNLGYLALIIPVIGSGTAITIQSLVRAWKERSLASGGIAAWNTFADVYNISQAVEHVPGVRGRRRRAVLEGRQRRGRQCRSASSDPASLPGNRRRHHHGGTYHPVCLEECRAGCQA